MTKQNKVKALQKRLNNQFFNSITFTYDIELNTVVLEVINVKEEYRKQGYGGNAIKQICDLCDEIQCLLVLYPSNEFGTPKTFLLRFYKKFGLRFERRKEYFDKYKHYMKRQPKPPQPVMFLTTEFTEEGITKEQLNLTKKSNTMNKKNEIEALKAETLQESNMVFKNKFWRYVNHKNKLLTKGFSSMADLIEYSPLISFSRESIVVMESRYNQEYVKPKKNV